MPRARTHIFGIPDQCATIKPHRLPNVTTIPKPTCLCNCLPQKSVQTTRLIPPWNCMSINAYNYIYTGNGLTPRVGSTTIQCIDCT